MKLKMSRILLLSVLSPLFIAVAASASPIIVLQPSSEQVVLGGEFTLWVNVQEVNGLFAASFELEYDASLLEVTDASAGDFLSTDVIFFDMLGDGSTSIAISKKAGGDSASGTGTLATLKVKGNGEGMATISIKIDTLALIQSDGNLIPDFDTLTVMPGTVTIGSGQTRQSVISIEPADNQLKLGDEFTLNVAVSDVEGLFGASLEIQYNGNVLDCVSASAGDFMGKDVIFFDIKGDNSVSIAVTMKAGANPVIGSGAIATVTFISKAEGTSQISYRQETLDLRRADGTLIPVAVEDGAITVIDAGVTSLVLSIAPSSKQVSIGDQFPIQIRIDNATGLFATSFELQFDKTMLKAVSAIPDDFLGGDVIHMAVPGDGSISVGISKKAGAAGVDGSGVIALVVLEAIGDGDTDVSFNTETITLKGLDDSPIDGSDSLEVSFAHISIRKPSLVADGKLVKTWGDVKTWP